jgi:hypothetical protein
MTIFLLIMEKVFPIYYIFLNIYKTKLLFNKSIKYFKIDFITRKLVLMVRKMILITKKMWDKSLAIILLLFTHFTTFTTSFRNSCVESYFSGNSFLWI